MSKFEKLILEVLQEAKQVGNLYHSTTYNNAINILKTNTIYSVTEKIYLLTNSNEIILPNFINWSKKEVKTYCTLANINCEINGNGYVIEQSIEPNTKLTKEDKLTITLKNKIKE